MGPTAPAAQLHRSVPARSCQSTVHRCRGAGKDNPDPRALGVRVWWLPFTQSEVDNTQKNGDGIICDFIGRFRMLFCCFLSSAASLFYSGACVEALSSGSSWWTNEAHWAMKKLRSQMSAAPCGEHSNGTWRFWFDLLEMMIFHWLNCQ